MTLLRRSAPCSEIAKRLRQWTHTQTSTAIDLPIAGDADLTCTCVWSDTHAIYTGRHAHVQVSTVSKNGAVTVGKGPGISRRGQLTPKTGASTPGPAAAASAFTPPADLRARKLIVQTKKFTQNAGRSSLVPDFWVWRPVVDIPQPRLREGGGGEVARKPKIWPQMAFFGPGRSWRPLILHVLGPRWRLGSPALRLPP